MTLSKGKDPVLNVETTYNSSEWLPLLPHLGLKVKLAKNLTSGCPEAATFPASD